MFPLFTALSRLFQGRPADGGTLPSQLFEAAESRAGLDPMQAQELREAAAAAMRVVR
jgi:hypothetical protein